MEGLGVEAKVDSLAWFWLALLMSFDSVFIFKLLFDSWLLFLFFVFDFAFAFDLDLDLDLDLDCALESCFFAFFCSWRRLIILLIILAFFSSTHQNRTPLPLSFLSISDVRHTRAYIWMDFPFSPYLSLVVTFGTDSFDWYHSTPLSSVLLFTLLVNFLRYHRKMLLNYGTGHLRIFTNDNARRIVYPIKNQNPFILK